MTQGGEPRVAAAAGISCPVCGAGAAEPLLRSHDPLVGGGDLFAVLECAGCGLAFTSPRDIDFDRHYPSGEYHAYQPARDSRFNRLRMWLITRGVYGEIARRPPGRLLDVGCGAGELLISFRRRGWQVSGIEPSDQGVSVASARGIEVHHGTLDSVSWPAGSFEAIVLNHSLEHMPSPGDALAAARDLLAPEGFIAISVPNFGSWQRRVFGRHWFQLDVPRHLQHFEADTLRSLVESRGFRVVSLRSTSMMAGFSGSVQNAVLGRQVLRGRGARVVSMVLYPFVSLVGLFGEGDCLNLVAQRPS